MKTMMTVVFLSWFAACMIAEAAPFQMSVMPDVALHRRTTPIRGFSVGFWNENPGAQWQFGVVNGATGDSKGVQWGVLIPTFYNYADTYKGAQVGFINRAKDMSGLQWGAINMAKRMKGLQFGVVNYTRTPDGCLQVGLVNLMPENEWFSGLPREFTKGAVFVNWHF